MKKYIVMVDGHVYLDIKVEADSLEDALSKIARDGMDKNSIDLYKYLKSNAMWNGGSVHVNGVWETQIPDCRGE